jgi:hypothetical protein
MARAASRRIGGWGSVGFASVRRGISLIEVLVVMAILILGMLAIARLFPEGFASINFTEHITTSQRLTRLREEALRKRSDSLPDGIGAIDPANPALILNNLVPNNLLGTLRQYPIAGVNPPPDDPRFSDVNIARRVFGEQFPLAAPAPVPFSSVANERASLYRALFSPIYSEVAMLPAAAGVAAYQGTPMQRVVFQDPPQSDNFRNLTRLGHVGYGVNYENGHLYLISIDYERAFKIDFTFRDGANHAKGQSFVDNSAWFPIGTPPVTNPPNDPTGAVVQIEVMRYDMRTGTVDQLYTYDLASEQITSAAGPNTAPPPQYPYTPLPATSTLDAGTDFLYRRFTQIPANQPFGADVFQFKVYDTTFGLFGIHPQLADFPHPQQRGKGMMVKIDYDVDDWHILSHDEAVPTLPLDTDTNATGEEAYVIRLPAAPIKKYLDSEETLNFQNGQPETINTVEYQGLIRYYPDTPTRLGSTGIDLVIVDMETGYQITSAVLQRPGPDAPTGSTNSHGEINYRAGIIHLWKAENRAPGGAPITWLPPGGVGTPVTMDPAGRHIRVYYRSSNDFAVASFKPFTRYNRQPNLAGLQHREYYADYGATNPGEPGGGGYLMFTNADGEKTVAVDYSYLFDPNPTSPDPANFQLRTVAGELQKVSPPATAFAPDPGASGNRWWIRLSHPDPDPIRPSDPTADPNVVPGSVQIRGVRGASLHTRVVWLEGRRMRHRERSTILTRGETR